ncbi:IclR family transcriptional regulator domain-containing protein [Azohydromonas lata]|uniref:IclR family transcriptional regulator C-terminal domain-containing protein n=1 Tax=Azohydromonas lata TaxID=45677 RepID=A0ABU5IBJ5_9BURK|nr:IclR family transcriptional regulator C-terminal domain-containing protein [Azohydromonas lata]MDZ5456322.1 IclR family transcriptional regulator C-terminal domain-containing protein [Azohydromonas lata]
MAGKRAQQAEQDPQAEDAPDAAHADAGEALKPGDGYVQSFARGLEVLRSFGAQAPAQTLSEAAQRAGLTRAGARRILLTLQTLGYVEQDGRQFRLTPKVMELGFAYLSAQPWWHLAQPLMEELTQQLKQSTSAAVLDGADIVYVLRVPMEKIMSINLGVGSRLPAHCTSMGRVLLAGLAEEQREARVGTLVLEPLTPRTITDPEKLLATLSQVRRQGYALVNEELQLGLMSLAVPIKDRGGRVMAAINVSSPAQRQTAAQMQKACLPALQAVAERISAMLPR